MSECVGLTSHLTTIGHFGDAAQKCFWTKPQLLRCNVITTCFLTNTMTWQQAHSSRLTAQVSWLGLKVNIHKCHRDWVNSSAITMSRHYVYNKHESSNSLAHSKVRWFKFSFHELLLLLLLFYFLWQRMIMLKFGSLWFRLHLVAWVP